MREDETLVIRESKGGGPFLYLDNVDGQTYLSFERVLTDWIVRRGSDLQKIAVVRGDGDGGVSRYGNTLDTNHLARVVVNLKEGHHDRAARLGKGFVNRHRALVMGGRHVQA